MPVSDAYLMDLQIEDLMYDQIDAQELEDADLPDWFLTDDDQDLEASPLNAPSDLRSDNRGGVH